MCKISHSSYLMKHFLSLPIIFLVLPYCLLLSSCGEPCSAKQHIAYINSYHRGHPSSDEIMAAVQESFPAESYRFTTFLMDTKRNTDLDFIQRRAAGIADSILAIDPDILIVSDDNAVKYVAQPLAKDHDLPIVFCGVNWSDQEYDLPTDQVTGMLEILPVAEVLEGMRSYYPAMEKLLVLTESTTTSRKEAQLLDTLFQRTGLTAVNQLVDNFTDWKTAFLSANTEYDIIYLPTNGGIQGWDHEEAVQFVARHIQVPVVTCEDFMMPYVVFGMTKVAREQGLWAAETAQKILNGSSPAEFPVTRNQQVTVWLNAELANTIGFQPDSLLLEKAKWVDIP